MWFTILLAGVAADDSARFQRYERWAEEARIALCAEAIIQCRDDRLAEKMADLLLPLRKWPFPQPENPRFKREHFGPVFQWGKPGHLGRPDHYKGESVFASNADSHDSNVFVRADRCAVQFTNRGGWFVAVRDSVTEKFRVGLENFPGEWYSSVVIVGSSATLSRTDHSLVVCDGDLKLTYETTRSVIIANGTIECDGGVNGTKFYATGKVKTPKDRMKTGEVHEDGKDMPVKFLDLGRDLGLRVTDKFVLEGDWRGLRKGDVITKVGGAVVDSVPALRRHIRTGVVRGASAVEVRRGSETVTLTVRLDLAKP